MANVLKHEKRLDVLGALVKGMGIRGASETTGVHQDTIGRFGFAVGMGCVRLHNRLARDMTCPLVDMDEQHSWCGVRQVNLDPTRHDPAVVGEQWTWAAICRASKLIISWVIGKRDQEHADALVADVRARLCVMPQFTTDGLKLYESSILESFGPAAPYAQMIKRFSNGSGRPGTAEKFAVPAGVDFIEKRVISGAPDLDKTTTYAIERSNLTNRTWNARLHRRTLCFSKRLDRHEASIALGYVFRNLCHKPRNMRQTAAMAADITDHIWDLEELMVAALAEPEGEKPEPKPLVIPKPEGPTRELPGDRGWLRVLPGAGRGSPSPSAPSPAPAPPAPAMPVPGSMAPVVTQGPAEAIVELPASPHVHPEPVALVRVETRPAAAPLAEAKAEPPAPPSASAAPPAAAAPAPSAPPPASPQSPTVPAVPPRPSPMAPKPKPRSKRLPPDQLSLFGIDFDPER